jgi:SAM-dependent methyltransferase
MSRFSAKGKRNSKVIIMPNKKSKDEYSDLSKTLEAQEYVNERLNPSVRSSFYLHLADLRRSLDAFKTQENLRILDYGCGGSPYRTLFPNSQYVRADFVPCEDLDLLLPSDSTIPVADHSFDMVISTQVLEHVPEPAHYVAECFRVLKPGGKLVLTTHGLFEDHGCPYDFQRWTTDGLRILLETTGFHVRCVQKLTCGPRALLFFINTGVHHLRAPNWSIFGMFLRMFRGLWRVSPSWLNVCADTYFMDDSIVDAKIQTATKYIAILAHGERPSFEPERFSIQKARNVGQNRDE